MREEEGTKAGEGRRESPGRDLSKPGTFGRIDEIVEKWLDGLGKSVPSDQIFVIDENSKPIDIAKVERPCPGTYFVCYQSTFVLDGGFDPPDYEAACTAAENNARPEADRVAQACDAAGCEAKIELDYESWTRTVDGKGTVGAYVEVILKVSCFTL